VVVKEKRKENSIQEVPAGRRNPVMTIIINESRKVNINDDHW
jgi:hypothetical protein